ncbi:MAG: fatty acid--CoA ligase [Desulfohalobiaceae bacterium]|nr:fatty acid--CoA ligase [Desulfohalobiaceae bacterium]
MSQTTFPPGDPYEYPLVIKKILNTPLIYAPDQEIVYRDKLHYTYRDLYDRIQRLASGLEKLGVGQGDTVAVFDYDSNRFLECFFAVPMMGAVMQMVNWRLSAEQILYTLNHSGAKAILVHSDFLPILTGIREQLTRIEIVVIITEDGSALETGASCDAFYEAMLVGARERYDFPDLDENAKATTFYTTGTTGLPKGVHFTHRQLVLHTLSVAVAAGCYDGMGDFRADDVYMPLTPMFHAHAWGVPYVATLLGAKQVYPGKYEPAMLLKLINTEKVTFSHCVPTILQILLNSPEAKSKDLSRWKVIIGGSALSRGLAMEARERGITVYGSYGMSETCPVMSMAKPRKHMMVWEEDRLLSVICKSGVPIPLAEIEIMDAQGNALPHDGVTAGEVVMRSPWLTKSYFKSPGKSAELWQGGWLHSGDVGHIDAYGNLKITDRIKDVVKSGGEWVSSLDLENLMSRHEAVLESAAIGVPDEKWGERPLMLIVLKPDFRGRVNPEDLKKHMQVAAEEGKLPRYGVPERYELVDEIPKTSVGKLDKKVMRKVFQ